MNFEVIEFCVPKHALRQRNISIGDLKEFFHGGGNNPPLLFFIVDEELDDFVDAADGLIVDKGRKHPAKALSNYFPSQSGCYAIRAEYSKAGRALQGGGALLKGCAHKDHRLIFLIGVPYGTFLMLKDDAEVSEAPSAAGIIDGEYVRRQNMLLGGEPEIAVPPSLVKAFAGTSDVAVIVRKQIMLAAQSDFRVLIQGDSGTGKEIVARQIHNHSWRKDKGQFIVVNCGGISENLFLSELFGHKKGTFTDAISDKPGLWTMAHKGTLFLDEIGDLAYHHQVKVLRALEDRRYYPVGGTEEVESDARIICATNKNLVQMIADGAFREDLYYRLRSLLIKTFPLRKHREDIPCLASLFWKNYSGNSGIELPGNVLEELQRWPWSGNARDVRGFLERLWSIIRGRPVTLELAKAVLEDYFGCGLPPNEEVRGF